MLLALLLAASAQKEKPPAHLVVPKSLQEQREREKAAEQLPLFSDPKLIAALGDLNPERGAWVEYLVRPKGAQDVRVRISVLPEELPGGRYWLELDSATPGGPPAAAKLLLRGSPAKTENLERMLIYIPGQAPVELPLDDLPQEAPREAKARPLPKVIRGSPERVQVHAGTFPRAQPVRIGDMRLWRSADVPLWGLVKAQSPRQTVELLGSGRAGAHSVFPEVPQGNGSESVK